MRRLIYGGFLLLSAATVSAGTFEQLYRSALDYDAKFAAARAQYEGDLEHRAIGRAGLYPRIALSGRLAQNAYERRELAPPQAVSQHDYASRSLSLRLTQPIFDMQRWAAWQEGDSRAELAEVEWANAQQDLALRFAQAYFDYLLARDTLALSRVQKTAIAAQKDRAENLYKSGSATVTDIEETKARLQLAESAELAAGNAAETRRRELERLVGALPDDLPGVDALVPTQPDPADLDTWIGEARTRNYAVSAQRIAEAIAGHQLDRAKAGHYPTAELVMAAQASDDPNYFTSREDSGSVAVEVSLPLFEGGRVSAQARQAHAAQRRARHELDSALREAEVQAREYYLNLQNGVAQIHALEAARRSSEIALEGMNAGHKVGLRTNTDVLDAQQQLYDVRRSLQQERYRYLLNRMQLQSVVGSLGGEEIARIDELIAR